MFQNYLFIIISIYLSVLLHRPATAATLPNGFVENRIAQNLNPVDIEFAPDGRLFLVEKNGVVSIYKNGNWLSKPFLSITGVVDVANERGMQGIVFDPNFPASPYVYIYYTRKGTTNQNPAVSTNSFNKVSRFTVSGDTAIVISEFTVLDINYLTNNGTHNGGGLVFGNDGKLYIATGDNGNGSNSQSFNTLLGKILRINSDGSIPQDNPFYATATGINRSIYALGLRNPFKMAIQPGTGRIFVHDVGQSTWEEINEVGAARNFGWPGIEGNRASQTAPANYQDPFYTYQHSGSNGCSITAGLFYNPSVQQFPSSLTGRYLYADYCGGYIRSLDLVAKTVTGFITNINRPVDMTIDNNGTLFYVPRAGLGGGSVQDNTSSSDGEIWMVQYTGNGNVAFSVQPTGKSVSEGGNVSFIASANGNQPITYQWFKNNVSIPGANSNVLSLTNVPLSDNGAQYKVSIQNLFSSTVSGIAVLTVIANKLPTVTITSPVVGSKYIAGQTLSFSGIAVDTEDGTLTGSAFTWWIDFHHDDHTHPALDATSGLVKGTYAIPTSGETSDNVWFRIYLRVKDSKNATQQTFVEVYPEKTDVTLKTNVEGITIKLDGASVNTPLKFRSVVGLLREIEAEETVLLNGKTYTFSGWSNAGQRAQTIIPTLTDTLFIANYTEVISSTTTGLSEQSTADPEIFYPNPNKTGHFLTKFPLDKISNLIVTDVLGKAVDFVKGSNFINIAALPKCFYIVHFKMGPSNYSGKLLYVDE